MSRVRRALISCSDKTGLADFGRALAGMGVEILSTGGTARHLQEAGVTVRAIDDFTGAPEILEGRVKTLHPRVHAGILFRRDHPEDLETMERLGHEAIDMVVVNLYPFREVVARPDVTDSEAIENIDIGGPTLLRAAAKNHRWVTAVCNPARYPEILEAMRRNDGAVDDALRRRLALEVFSLTSEYDAAIAEWLRGAPEERGT